jgi:hypothetical protein
VVDRELETVVSNPVCSPPVKQQLGLLNRDQVSQANDAACQLSIEALARAEAGS